MPLKASLQKDHIPTNKFSMFVLGMPNFAFVYVSGLEEEIDMVDLPDRTRASGGNTQPIEFTVRHPLHHTLEHAALEVWFNENKDPISLTAKKIATLTMLSGSGATSRTYTLLGVWPSKRKLPDLEFENEGEMALTEWTFQADSMLPI